METAQEVAAYEPDEDEKVTAAVLKKALKSLIADLKDSPGESATKELQHLREQDNILKDIETRIKKARATLKDKSAELKLKLQFKRVGTQDYQAETRALIKQVDGRLADIAHTELERYLNAEKRSLVLGIENLWDKYAVSSRELEQERDATVKTLDGLLDRLGYLR